MALTDRLIYHGVPNVDTIVDRTPIDGATCPEHGGSDIRRYPIGWVGGHRIAVKCQTCFRALEIEIPRRKDAWPPSRSATRDWDVSSAESASAPAQERRR